MNRSSFPRSRSRPGTGLGWDFEELGLGVFVNVIGVTTAVSKEIVYMCIYVNIYL